MEPLSVVGSIIAVAQAADRVTALLAVVKPYLNAPAEVAELQDEIYDLNSLLKDLEIALREFEDSSIVTQEQTLGLQRSLDKADVIVRTLEHMIENNFTKTSTGGYFQVDRLGWARKIGKVARLKDKLRDNRLTMVAYLQGFQLLSQAQMKRTLDEILAASGRQLAEQSNHQRNLIQHFETHTVMLGKLLDQQGPQQHINKIESTSIIAAPSKQPNHNVVDVTTSIWTDDNLDTFAAMRTRFLQTNGCRSGCPCSCHSKYRLRTPSFLSSLTGSLSLSYTGLPVLSSYCNEPACARRSETAVRIFYKFPEWLLWRVLQISMMWSTPRGPELLIRILRIRSFQDASIRMVVTNNIQGIRSMILQGDASIFDVDPKGQSPLSCALFFNNLDILQMYLQFGGNPHQEDDCHGNTFNEAWVKILGLAGDSTYRNRLELLFPAPTVFETLGFTVLHQIVVNRLYKDLDDEVRSAGTFIDATDNQGRTALSWAAMRGDAERTQKLLDLGADPNVADIHALTPLHLAFECGNLGAISTLLKAPAIDVNAQSLANATPLLSFMHNAAQWSNQFPDMLFEYSEEHDIDKYEDRGIASMFFAFLDRGSDLNLCSVDSQSPFFWAVGDNIHTLIHLLLDYGADYHTVDDFKRSIVHAAAEHADLKTLKALTSYRLSGLDVTQKNNLGLTPIDLAERRKSAGPEWVQGFWDFLESINSRKDETAYDHWTPGKTSSSWQPTDTPTDGHASDEKHVESLRKESECTLVGDDAVATGHDFKLASFDYSDDEERSYNIWAVPEDDEASDVDSDIFEDAVENLDFFG